MPELWCFNLPPKSKRIEEFILGEFTLKELEELTSLNGFQFKDLLESRQRKTKNRSIRGIRH